VFRQSDAQLVSVALSVKRLLRRNRKKINETRSVTATGYSFPGPAGSKSLPLSGLRHANGNVIFAYWRFMFACWLTCGYFNIVSNVSQQKNGKKSTFFGHPDDL